MIKIKQFQSWLQNHQVKLWFLYLSILFLPLSMRLNNLFLGIFVAFFILEGNYSFKYNNIKTNFRYVLILSVFFLIIALGTIYSEFIGKGLKQVERSLPFLIIPIIFLSEPKEYDKKQNNILISLVVGCILAAIICWAYLAYDVVSNNAYGDLLTWKYSKLNLIKPIDQHTPYLSLFVLSAIGFLVSHTKTTALKAKLKNISMVILTLFLFHLLSRTAIIYFCMASMIYLFFNKKYITAATFAIIICSLFSVLIINSDNKSNYFAKLFVDQMGINGTANFDGRFERWKHSYDMFLEEPFFGIGTGDADAYRAILYRKNNDIEGFKNRFNSHNQFLEFLSGQGVIGGIWFLFSFYFLLSKAYKLKEYLFFYIICGMFFCCITESMFRVSWGIVFFSIITSLFLSRVVTIHKRQNELY